MHKFIMLLFSISLLFSLSLFNVYAYDKSHYDKSYSVSGKDEDGNSVKGTIYRNSGESSVRGELTDEHNDTHEFLGRWNGHHITGQTNDGKMVELNTN